MQLADHRGNPNRPTGVFRPIVVGAMYPAVERGLAADLAATKAVSGLAYPVCTLLLMAGYDTVTDATDVPVDTVRAQLEHLEAVTQPTAMKIGVLASHGAAGAVLDFAGRFSGPIVMDLQISGPTGETVLTSRGIDVVMERLAVPDLVIIDRSDAEPLSGGEIHSLDDAQVAAQRLVKRGAQSVVIKCGNLPSRHFETQGDDAPPSALSGEEPFNADLYFDGEEFALFEAPHLVGGSRDGASSAFAIAALHGMSQGKTTAESLQLAKRYVTEGLRRSGQQPHAPFNFSWNA